MKAYYVTELAHPSKIPVSTNVPVPVPKKGEVLVDVYSAGLNFFDVRLTMNHEYWRLMLAIRFYKHKGNIRPSLLYHSSQVQNSLVG